MTFNNYILAGVIYLSAVPAALACAFHGMPEVQLEGMYPGSLSVAVALRSAADNGVIDAAALEAPSKRVAGYNDSVHRLQEFGKALARRHKSAGELLAGLCGEQFVDPLFTVGRQHPRRCSHRRPGGDRPARG